MTCVHLWSSKKTKRKKKQKQTTTTKNKQKTNKQRKRNKAIMVLRGKSRLSGHVLEKIKSHNSLGFSKGFVKGENFIFVKILFCFISSSFFS